MLANVLRRKISFIRNSLMSTAVFAGFIMLVLISFAAKSDTTVLLAIRFVALYLAALLLFMFKAGKKKEK